jgi:Family of unknown function (DUF6788)
MPTSDLDAMLQQRDQLKSELAAIGDMRPGSLVSRYRKCGKISCHCAKQGAAGHGPSYSLTHAVRGKTVTNVIPTGPAVERTQEQIEEYRRFRQLIQQLITVSEKICDLQLRQQQRHPEQDNKKNRAGRPSGR